MIESFELGGRKYEGPVSEGKDAMSLFRKSSTLAVECGFYGGAATTAEMLVSLGASSKAEPVVKETLKGWSVDGVAIDDKNWSELFEKKGNYLDPYAASFRIWLLSGFLAVGTI